jgi:hypothetical protein
MSAVSIEAACAQTEEMIARARSLFAADAQPSDAPTQAAASLQRGAQETVATRQPMSALSGVLADRQRAFVEEISDRLGAASHADIVLGAQLHRAAALTEVGRRRLDGLAALARANTVAASSAKSPAAQRAILANLKSLTTQTQDVVRTARQGAAEVADGIRALTYPARRGAADGPDDRIVGDDRSGQGSVQMVDDKKLAPPPPPPRPGQPVDPTNPFVGDSRLGHWEDVPPAPPYVGAPPPLKDEFRRYPDGTPLKVGPTTGMYTPGKSWIGDIDPPAVQGQEEYRFRLAGTDATTTTRMVNDNGQWVQQRWVQNVYEYQRNSSVTFGGDVGSNRSAVTGATSVACLPSRTSTTIGSRSRCRRSPRCRPTTPIRPTTCRTGAAAASGSTAASHRIRRTRRRSRS